MRSFYTAPTATVSATPPAATFHALVCPGAPQWSVVVVESWVSNVAEDAWDDLPNVTEHHPENMGGTIPQVVVTAFAPWGVTLGMSYREAFGVIRRKWPIWRDA